MTRVLRITVYAPLPLVTLVVLWTSSAAGDEKYDPAARLGFRPRARTAVQWLPEPYPVLQAAAENEAEMRKYNERPRGTDVAFDMLPIPGGTFLMGSPDDEKDRNDEDEGPQVEMEIEPFWMGACEVTWGEYETWTYSEDVEARAIKGHVDTTPDDWLADAVSRPTPPYTNMDFDMGHDGYPAICMTQYAAKAYCKWLCAKTGRYYRLPTEAEWEYACRAGTTTAYSFGDDADDLEDHAWYFDNCPDGYGKVGKKKPNPWGLYDMHGNVAEWVLDQYLPDCYQQRADGKIDSPFVIPKTEYPRVARGGSWDDDADRLRSAARRESSEDWKSEDPQFPQSIWYHTDADFLGFRVVRPLKTPTTEEAKLYEPDLEIESSYNMVKGIGD